MVKLLTTARDSDNDAERLAAYSLARAELARLDRAGVIHMPRTAQAVLEVAGPRAAPGLSTAGTRPQVVTTVDDPAP